MCLLDTGTEWFHKKIKYNEIMGNHVNNSIVIMIIFRIKIFLGYVIGYGIINNSKKL